MPHRTVSPWLRQNARRLRRDMTDVERRLWGALRGHRLGGVGFRRQLPIGRFIVDFACLEARLIIELDGSQHADNPGDAARDAELTAMGFRVLRFWNADINAEFAAAMDRIYTALIEQGLPLQPSGIGGDPDRSPHPVPPLQGGRERRRRARPSTSSPQSLCAPIPRDRP